MVNTVTVLLFFFFWPGNSESAKAHPQDRQGTSAVVHFLGGACHVSCGSQFPSQGLNLCPLDWKHGVLTTDTREVSVLFVLNHWGVVFFK